MADIAVERGFIRKVHGRVDILEHFERHIDELLASNCISGIADRPQANRRCFSVCAVSASAPQSAGGAGARRGARRARRVRQ